MPQTNCQFYDADVRKLLYRNESTLKPHKSTVIIEEFELCQGGARIDIAAINGNINGYEIKSDYDTLARLPSQVNIYNKVMDTVTLVLNANHLSEAKTMIPPWWGIKLFYKSNKERKINIIRQNQFNPGVDAFSLVQLLWKSEILEFLKMNGREKGVVSKPKYLLWEILANDYPLNILKDYVRATLKSRGNWRAAQQR